MQWGSAVACGSLQYPWFLCARPVFALQRFLVAMSSHALPLCVTVNFQLLPAMCCFSLAKRDSSGICNTAWRTRYGLRQCVLCCCQVVFVHKPSGTLIAADLIWDYPRSGTPKATQAWKFGMDQVYRPFYNNLMIKDKGWSPML